MLTRRMFFSAAVSAVAGGVAGGAAQSGQDVRHEIGDRPILVFRRNKDGRWLEIQPQQVKKGDLLICLGFDPIRREIFKVGKHTAASDWRPCPATCKTCKKTHRGGCEVIDEEFEFIA